MGHPLATIPRGVDLQMSTHQEELLQRFRDSVYARHHTGSLASTDPHREVLERALAFVNWYEAHQSKGELPGDLLRHWVAADLTALRNAESEPDKFAQNVALSVSDRISRNRFVYDGYAEILREMDFQLYQRLPQKEPEIETFSDGFTSGKAPTATPAEVSTDYLLKLLDEVTYESRSDGSVLYKLRDKAAFVDHGEQLLMAAGAKDDEDAILVGIHLAKQKFGGSIELTGSDEFQRRVIEVMIKHNVEVELSNPAQDAMRRSLMGKGLDVQQGDQVQQPAARPAEPARQSAAEASSAIPSAPAVESTTPTTNSSSQPAAAPVSPLHGEVADFGSAPYKFNAANSRSFYISLINSDGETRTTWGADLERVVREASIAPGDQIALANLGRQPVTIEVPVKDPQGNVTGIDTRQAFRNEWAAEVHHRAETAAKVKQLDPEGRSGESLIFTKDEEFAKNLGLSVDELRLHPQLLGMRAEEHALHMLMGTDNTTRSISLVSELMASEEYRVAFVQAVQHEHGKLNSHFKAELEASESFAVTQELLKDAERKHGPIDKAATESYVTALQNSQSTDVDALLTAITKFDEQYAKDSSAPVAEKSDAPAAVVHSEEPVLIMRGTGKGLEGDDSSNLELYRRTNGEIFGTVVLDGVKADVTARVVEGRKDALTGEVRGGYISLYEHVGDDADMREQKLGYGNAINRRQDGNPVNFDEVAFNVEGKVIKAKVVPSIDQETHATLGFKKPLVPEEAKPAGFVAGPAPEERPVPAATAGIVSRPKTAARA